VRILFANHTSDWSGAEVALMRLISTLRDDHALAVACPNRGRLAAEVDAAGVERLPLPAADVSLRPHPVLTPLGVGRLVLAGGALRVAARRHAADVIHANSLRAGLSAAVAARLGAPPAVVQVHEHLPASMLGRATREAIARSAAAVVGVTEYTAANFNKGLSVGRAERVYISIDHERFDPDRVRPAPLRRELALPAETVLIGEVAQITPWKGQETAIRMLSAMRRGRSDVHLVLAGDVAFKTRFTRFDNERYLRHLHALIADLGLSGCVHFVGQRDDVPEVLRALDLTVLPSWSEPFGTVAAESMAMGTPPLVGRVGGVPEYVEDGRSGVVLTPDDPEEWARAALGLLADPDRLAAMGARAREVAGQFSDRRYAELMLATYERAAAGQPGHAAPTPLAASRSPAFTRARSDESPSPTPGGPEPSAGR
jgi:glycosyltransferase involved in cell wall biosynthesis